MTQQEAVSLVEHWIQEYSLLAAQVVHVTPAAGGAWIVQAECSEAIWRQKVSPAGEVGAPELIVIIS